MQKDFEEKCHKLAQFSQKAREIAKKLDEDLTDRLSLMDLNFSFDGLGKLYNDLGKTCEVSKLAKISGKCVDLAKKFADEVSADWLGLEDNDPIDEESVEITCENIEPQIKLNENEEERDDLAISAVSNDNSESTNANNASDQESEIKTPLDNAVICQEAASQDKVTDDMLCSQVNVDVIHDNEVLLSEGLQNNKTSDIFSLEDDVIPIKTHGDLDALSEVSKSNDDSSSVVSNDKTDEITAENVGLFTLPEILKHWDLDALVPSDKIDEITAEAFDLFLSEIFGHSNEDLSEALRHDITSNMSSSEVDVVPIEAHVDPNALVEVGKSHDVSSPAGPGDKTDETTAEADNLVNFSKPLECGGFEDVDLKDDWEDDIDYDLDLVSYYESNKKPYNKKMAAKFISRWRSSLKSWSSEVAHKPDANSADSDWELL